jgi:hypothetical protein
MSDIQIVQFDPTTGLASLGMGNAPKIIHGMDKLKQIVVLEYFRDPGQSVLNPNEGAGLRAAIGQYNIGSPDALKLYFVQRTQFIAKKILSYQQPGVGMPSERLTALTVLDVATDSTGTRLAGSVQITSEAGDIAQIVV